MSAVLAAITTSGQANAEGPELRFSRDIRPILASNCFECHGPDAQHRKADLRLDTAEGVAQAFGETDLSENETWDRLTSTDPDYQMPPPSAHKEVKPAELALIRQWIQQGAAWEGHWAFIAPTMPAIPQVKAKDRVENPIDAFILSRLELKGLAPSPPATRERLLRRVTFDLTGLPPTLAEIDAFKNDTSPEAYAKVVDRLLASQRFGERMGLMWMDIARYGDSSVFHADGPRDMWPWRDWVINAYNKNKPFDKFTVEQLAGDLLPNATLDQKIATGFNRNNATTDEGGAIAEEYRVEYAVDRVKTTSMTWLALTMECAQCHDHKYDPVPQREYYQFYAYFNQSADPGMQTRRGNQSPVVNVPDIHAAAKVLKLREKLAPLEKQMAARRNQSEQPFATWLRSKRESSDEQTLTPTDMLAHFMLDETSGGKVADQADDKRKATVKGKATWTSGKYNNAFETGNSAYINAGDLGPFERTDGFSYGAWIKPKGNPAGAIIARMDDANAHRGYDLYVTGGGLSMHIINSWPGNALKVTSKAKLKPNVWQHVFATYDGSGKAAGVKLYINGKEEPWNIEQNGLKDTIRTNTPFQIGRRSGSSQFNGLIDDVRVFARSLSGLEVAALAGSDPLAPLLALPDDKLTAKQRDSLLSFYLNSEDKPYQQLAKQLQKVKADIAAAEKPVSTVMVMADTKRMTYMLNRGDYASPMKDKPVSPGTPSALPPLPKDAAANRLGLAQWLVQPDHPLTSRVAVNRYWYMMFGKGIVSTIEDFGSQGASPTHPALLDWLAVDFVKNGWNIKRTLRQMVMSNTYRQTSRTTAALHKADPENNLYARAPRFRLQGEFIRDNALAASGLMVHTIGGPSVKPYQPAGLWNEVALSGNVRFVQDHGEKLYRRSMYTYWKRSAPAPAMTIFDTPSREKCIISRSRTNTPLQALVTLNDPQFIEAARVLAERVIHQSNDLQQQIITAYRLSTGVKPSAAVLKVLTTAFEEELTAFKKEPERANKLLAIGEHKSDDKINAAQHAALAIVCSMIFNLDETLTRG